MNYSAKGRYTNGDTLEWLPQGAHSENYEVESSPKILPKHSTVIRLLGHTNHANMGDYHQAITQYEQPRVTIYLRPCATGKARLRFRIEH